MNSTSAAGGRPSISAEMLKVDEQQNVEELAKKVGVERDESVAQAQDDANDMEVNTSVQLKKAEGKEKLKTDKAEKAQESVLVRQEAEELAGRFSQKHPQFQLNKGKLADLAEGLGTHIKGDTAPEAIITHIQVTMSENGRLPDVAQVDKALQFLIEVMQSKVDAAPAGPQKDNFTTILGNLKQARTTHEEMETELPSGKVLKNKDAIIEAEHTIGVAGVITKLEGGVSLPEAMTHVREMIHNPQELKAKLNYYRAKYSLAPEPIKNEIREILHYIGDQLRSRLKDEAGSKSRPEMENPEMNVLMTETKKDQAILQIIRQGDKAHALGVRISEVQDVQMPRNFTPEFVISLFVSLVDEAYPTADKVLDHISKALQGA